MQYTEVQHQSQHVIIIIIIIIIISLLFHAGQAAIKLPSAETSRRAQCTSPGQYSGLPWVWGFPWVWVWGLKFNPHGSPAIYTLHIGNNENSLELNTN